MISCMRVGIDLGGTKIELIALDDQGQECMRFRKATPAGEYEATVALIAEMVLQAECELGQPATVGVGTPGALSVRSGLMKNCNSTCLNGRPLKKDIESALNREIRLSNDANCFALSEAVDGVGEAAALVFGVILGTGVGGGLVVNGHLLEGVNRIAGEWGHNPLPGFDALELPGPACYCGRVGCIETWLSGPAISAAHLQQFGADLSAVQVARRAEAGDMACRQTLGVYFDHLARALAGVINIFDPDVIVLGGGVSNIKQLYAQVPGLWDQYIFSDVVNTTLLPPKYGDSSGVRGAAWLWRS